jgi:hypothetical protein
MIIATIYGVMLKIKKIFKNKKFFLLGALALLILGAGAVFSLRDSQPKPADSQSADLSNAEDIINLDPPTAQDAQRVDENKERLAEKQAQEDSQAGQSSTSKKQVTPIITYAGQYDQQIEVGAYVSVFEDNGTCSATFTNGSKSFVKTVQAVKNVSTTNCPAMAAQASEFSPKGSWTLVVTYDSPISNGHSASRTLVIN